MNSTATGDKPLRLAICVPQLKGGGAERIMVLVANRAVRSGVCVDMVLNQVTGPYLDDLDPRVEVVGLDARRVFEVIPKLAMYLRRRRPDRVLSTLYRQNFMVLMAKAAARSSAHVVVREANTFSLESANHAQARSIKDSVKVRVDRALLPVLYSRAGRVIAISEGVRQDLISEACLDPSLVVAIHNPIDLEMVDSRASETEEQSFWNEGREEPLVVSVGRLEPQKDFETLIRGFALARARTPMRLLILGEGSLRSNLEQLVRDLDLVNHVRLPGFVKNPFSYMSAAQAFALTSRWEGFGNVFIEALALGLPVVATDCPSGPSEILDKGRFGQLVPIADIAAVAEALVEAVHSPLSRSTLRARAEEFSVDAVLPKYWDALRIPQTVAAR